MSRLGHIWSLCFRTDFVCFDFFTFLLLGPQGLLLVSFGSLFLHERGDAVTCGGPLFCEHVCSSLPGGTRGVGHVGRGNGGRGRRGMRGGAGVGRPSRWVPGTGSRCPTSLSGAMLSKGPHHHTLSHSPRSQDIMGNHRGKAVQQAGWASTGPTSEPGRTPGRRAHLPLHPSRS